ncbi:hypothetical protein RHMOL_Rhmol10G0223300 [Rhododendron molle]|uniref:Uncharacterized protein n=1 Tax=Rhododendron molle TaxID=49168 RepID=A0ACC0M5I9_RHOML|nr:hypothetical protein RHMOL_Rhmol10G0223300 [Rhododendron molle]
MPAEGFRGRRSQTNSAGAAAQTLRALQDSQRQFLKMQKQLLAAFTGLTKLISAALSKTVASQDDEPYRSMLGVATVRHHNPRSLYPPRIPCVVCSWGESLETLLEPVDGTSTPSTGPYITMALLAQQKASEASRKELAVAEASTPSAGQFITMAEVQALLTKEKAKIVVPSLPSPNTHPPYLVAILSLPYPERYT